MFRTQPGPDRWRLGFAPTVLKAFAFLTEEFGFRCVRSDVTFVRYESSDVFVNVFHGRGSYELGVEIGLSSGQLGVEGELFTLREVIATADPEAEKTHYAFQVSKPEEVRKFVPRLAELVRQFAGPALRADPVFLRRLHELHSKRGRERTVEYALYSVRGKAAEAWRQKNYQRFVDLLEPVEKDLTPLEVRKLDYARKQLLKGRISSN